MATTPGSKRNEGVARAESWPCAATIGGPGSNGANTCCTDGAGQWKDLLNGLSHAVGLSTLMDRSRVGPSCKPGHRQSGKRKHGGESMFLERNMHVFFGHTKLHVV